MALNQGPALWCLTLPFAGKRALTPEERSSLAERHARDARRLNRAFWARRVVLSLMCLAVVVLTIFDTSMKYSRVGVFFIWAAIMFVMSGIVGAAIEVLFGSHIVVRCAFGVLLLAFFGVGLLGPTWTPKPTVTNVVGTVAGMALFVGGLCAWILGWRDEYSARPQMIAAGRDLARGEVLVFQGPDPDSGAEQTIAVLPESHFVVAVNDALCRSWTTADPTSTAPPPEDIAEHAVEDLRDMQDLPADEVAVTRRALSGAEIEDLHRETRHSLRKDIGQSLLLAWIVGILAGAARRFMGVRHRETLDVFGLTVAGLVLAFLLTRAILARRRLDRDIRAGQVLVMRPRTPVTDGPQVVEMLPESRILWTVEGKPAPWRTVSS